MSEKESHSVAILWVTLWNNASMWSVPPEGHGRMSPNSAFLVSLLLALYLTYSRCLVHVRSLHEQTHPEKYKAIGYRCLLKNRSHLTSWTSLVWWDDRECSQWKLLGHEIANSWRVRLSLLSLTTHSLNTTQKPWLIQSHGN